MHSLVINLFNHFRLCIFFIPLVIVVFCLLNISVSFAGQVPDISTLKTRPKLDDYYSNVVLGFNIINDTQTYASRFVGNKLNCTDCHRDAGRVKSQLPLNVAGIYPLWRSKNAQIADLSLVIRECFVYSLNGVMPPANAPEVTAIKTYISYLSFNQLIGKSPAGRGVPTLSKTNFEPNPINGQIVYQQQCTVCHGDDGNGISDNPSVWGMNSYSKGSGMSDIQLAASFIKIKMSEISSSSLSVQQAFDVASYLNKQPRPVNPGKRKLPKLFQDIYGFFQ